MKDKLIHTLRLSIPEQAALMEERSTLLNSETIELLPTTVDFLTSMVERLSSSIIQCTEMELQYEQGIINEEVECPVCLGSGWIDGDPCSHCNGKQVIYMLERGVL